MFSCTSWRFFTEKNLTDLLEHRGIFVAYVLAPDDGFKGDMFLFPIEEFVEIVRSADRLNNGNYRVYTSRSIEDSRWFVRRSWKFSIFDTSSVVDVSKHYRNFDCLN